MYGTGRYAVSWLAQPLLIYMRRMGPAGSTEEQLAKAMNYSLWRTRHIIAYLEKREHIFLQNGRWYVKGAFGSEGGLGRFALELGRGGAAHAGASGEDRQE